MEGLNVFPFVVSVRSHIESISRCTTSIFKLLNVDFVISLWKMNLTFNKTSSMKTPVINNWNTFNTQSRSIIRAGLEWIFSSFFNLKSSVPFALEMIVRESSDNWGKLVVAKVNFFSDSLIIWCSTLGINLLVISISSGGYTEEVIISIPALFETHIFWWGKWLIKDPSWVPWSVTLLINSGVFSGVDALVFLRSWCWTFLLNGNCFRACE